MSTIKMTTTDKVINLMMRKDGITVEEAQKVGFKQPTIAAIRVAARRGLKTSIVKRKGELTRYIATKKPAKKA